METQTVSLTELIALTFFLGSIIFLLGAVYQIIALTWINKKVKWYKIIWIVLITRVLTLIATVLIWKGLFQNIEIMFGPILLPGLIAELVFSPLILKLLKFNIIKKR